MAPSPSWMLLGPLQTQEPYTTKMQRVKPQMGFHLWGRRPPCPFRFVRPGIYGRTTERRPVEYPEGQMLSLLVGRCRFAARRREGSFPPEDRRRDCAAQSPHAIEKERESRWIQRDSSRQTGTNGRDAGRLMGSRFQSMPAGLPDRGDGAPQPQGGSPWRALASSQRVPSVPSDQAGSKFLHTEGRRS